MPSNKKKKGNVRPNNKKKKKGLNSNKNPNKIATTTEEVTEKLLPDEAILHHFKPGSDVLLQHIKRRPDLNGKSGKVDKLLQSGRIAVQLIHLEGTAQEKKETISVLPEKIKLFYSKPVVEKDDCDICYESDVVLVYFPCCPKGVCIECFDKINKTGICPMCRSDITNMTPKKEFKLMLERAERGEVDACYELGNMYNYGKCERKQDAMLACKWYKKAADRGCVDSMHALGNLYMFHKDMLDNERAAKFFKLAADSGGDGVSDFKYATMVFDERYGLDQNLDEAAKYFEMSITKGCRRAIEHATKIGIQYAKEDGNCVRAVKFFRLLASAGNADGEYWYRQALLIGDGVDKNYE